MPVSSQLYVLYLSMTYDVIVYLPSHFRAFHHGMVMVEKRMHSTRI